ncbi:Endonuclease III conserved site-2 [Penicillium paradoxum]|uniref:Endonuclease III conserved site-2 n=1 Tax=Penicillium paradoxum TaxID=176176 RepID=UPI002547AFA3|nr:Endonuclease III conserved site-2 [Penicillium paradoxum]KAJ5780351.1 Endonuclease III conserved site-2 [Penicillium paradoxum]
MRTSRTSKDTAKVLQALSSPVRRQTRNSSAVSALKSFAYNANATPTVKTEPESVAVPPSLIAESDDDSVLSEADTADIEDLLEPPPKRQKRNASPLNPPVPKKSPRTPRKVIVKNEPDQKPTPAPKARRLPARKTRDADGLVKVEPPSNWETMYNTIKQMRADNPTAPVDTMGCSELYWRASSPQDRRFQTLIALMLSSQTKDTVTAVAMQRLHTELGDDSPDIKIKLEDESNDTDTKDSTLNLKNILAVDPTRLNELIRTVGFHNNKTKYIKATALILRDQHDGDIPSTPEGLMALPGVGPKMAYLCLSAAWGKHEGIGVDVHVHRITNLWGWNKTKNPEETRMALQSWLPHDKWHEINKLLVGLGQTVCLPVKRRCGDCYLAGSRLCKSEIRGLEPTMSRVKRSPELDEPKVKIEAV